MFTKIGSGCFSVTVYCAPVWCRSAHNGLFDAQLNTTMRLISGTLRPTPLPWQPVLANIKPPALRRKAAADRLVEKASADESWPLQHDISNPPHPESLCGVSWNQLTSTVSGENLEVGFGGQCPPRGRPHNPTARFCFPSTTVVSPEPLSHRTRSLRCL